MNINILPNGVTTKDFREYSGINIYFKGYAIWNDQLYFDSEFDAIVIEHYFSGSFAEKYPQYNGIFNLIIQDNNKITVVRDRWGIDPLYYVKTGSAIYISDCWEKLIDHSEQKTDNQALFELITIGYALGNKTMVQDIKEFEPHCTYTIFHKQNELKTEHKDYWSLEHTFPKKKRNINYEKQLADLWKKQIAIYTDYITKHGNSVYMPFSGGLDCRLIAHELNEKKIDLYALTYGRNQNNEVISAQNALNNLSNVKDHYILELDKHNTTRIFDQSNSRHRITCAFPSELLHYYPKNNSHNQAFTITGFSGDFMAGSHLKYKMKLWKNKKDIAKHIIRFKSPAFLNKVIESNPEFYSKIENSLYSCLPDSPNLLSSFIRWDVEQRQRRYIARSAYQNQYKNQPRVLLPFFDYKLMDFFLQLPFDLLWNAKLYVNTQLKLMYKNNPDLIHSERVGKKQTIIKNNFLYEYKPKLIKTLKNTISPKANNSFNVYADMDFDKLTQTFKIPDYLNDTLFSNRHYPINKLYLYSISEAFKTLKNQQKKQ